VTDTCSSGTCVFGRQAVAGTGSPFAQIVLVGEAPGRVELQQGRPFVGPAGALLDRLLGEAGLRRADLYVTNICGCVDMTRDDRRPRPAELDACRPRLDAELALCDPAAVVLLGNTAIQYGFPGYRIGEVYGTCRAVDGRVLVPSYYPAAVLHGNKQVEPIIRDALALARRLSEDVT
jgi:uracil-DNA glycosylase family 4